MHQGLKLALAIIYIVAAILSSIYGSVWMASGKAILGALYLLIATVNSGIAMMFLNTLPTSKDKKEGGQKKEQKS